MLSQPCRTRASGTHQNPAPKKPRQNQWPSIFKLFWQIHNQGVLSGRTGLPVLQGLVAFMAVAGSVLPVFRLGSPCLLVARMRAIYSELLLVSLSWLLVNALIPSTRNVGIFPCLQPPVVSDVDFPAILCGLGRGCPLSPHDCSGAVCFLWTGLREGSHMHHCTPSFQNPSPVMSLTVSSPAVLSRWDSGADKTLFSLPVFQLPWRKDQVDREKGCTFISAKAGWPVWIRHEPRSLADSTWLLCPRLDPGGRGISSVASRIL